MQSICRLAGVFDPHALFEGLRLAGEVPPSLAYRPMNSFILN